MDSIREWHQSTIIALDANATRLWSENSPIPTEGKPHSTDFIRDDELDLGFIISDDKTLRVDKFDTLIRRSLGNTWLQGHMAIGVCHFLIDEGVELNI